MQIYARQNKVVWQWRHTLCTFEYVLSQRACNMVTGQNNERHTSGSVIRVWISLSDPDLLKSYNNTTLYKSIRAQWWWGLSGDGFGRPHHHYWRKNKIALRACSRSLLLWPILWSLVLCRLLVRSMVQKMCAIPTNVRDWSFFRLLSTLSPTAVIACMLESSFCTWAPWSLAAFLSIVKCYPCY